MGLTLLYRTLLWCWSINILFWRITNIYVS